MTKSQMKSLGLFDDEWRTLTNLRVRGVELDEVPFLMARRYVKMRQCGTNGYQITKQGRIALTTAVAT